MSWAQLRPVKCSLCGARFKMLWGEMVHPADCLCDGCIRSLWARADHTAPDVLGAELEAEFIAGGHIQWPGLGREMGRRAFRLRRMVSTEAELAEMLVQRAQAEAVAGE